MPAFPNPYGYPPFPYYPSIQPPAQIQPASLQPPTQQPSSIIWVGGLTEAQMYPVAPNAAVALWDSSAPAIYLKQADASGRPAMKIYDLVERTAPTQTTHAEQGKVCEYATKEALATLNSAFEEMRKDVAKIRAEMEAKE